MAKRPTYEENVSPRKVKKKAKFTTIATQLSDLKTQFDELRGHTILLNDDRTKVNHTSLKEINEWVQAGNMGVRISGPEMKQITKAQAQYMEKEEAIKEHFKQLNNMNRQNTKPHKAKNNIRELREELEALKALQDNLKNTAVQIRHIAGRRNEVLKLGDEARAKGISEVANKKAIAPDIQMLINHFVSNFQPNMPGSSIQDKIIIFILKEALIGAPGEEKKAATDLVKVLGGEAEFAKNFIDLLNDPILKERVESAQVQMNEITVDSQEQQNQKSYRK